MSKVIARFVRTEEEASRFIEDLNLGSQGVIIKPNWTSPDYGNCTDAKTLGWFLSRIPGRKYVVEGYIWARNDNSRSISVDNVDENRDWIREQDRWFLRTSGIGKLLEKYDAPYINVTEEFWQGRTVPAEEIKVETVGSDGDIRYWRDEQGLFHVPKRSLDELIVDIP